MTYYFSKQLEMPFEQAVQHVTEALAGKGFGVLTTIDVRATSRSDACMIQVLNALEYLDATSLPNVYVGLDKQGPLTDRRSGKLKEVVVAKETAPTLSARPFRLSCAPD